MDFPRDKDLEADGLAHAQAITAFKRRCTRDEYTDTDEAWRLLDEAGRLLRLLAK